MRKVENFLINITNIIKESLFQNNDFSTMRKFLSNNEINRYSPYDFEDTKKHLSELKNILDKIISIVFNPHIKATTEEVIMRSELSSHLSSESFKNTIMDSKLWKNKDGEMVPEYVHTKEYIDTIVTYENGFICFLTDLINQDIYSILSDISPFIKPIEMEYETKGLSYGIHSPLNDLAVNKYPYKMEFLKEKISCETVVDIANNLIKKIKNIKASEFYILNHKSKMESNISRTNILIHDNLYSHCYRFYQDNYVNNIAASVKTKNIYYFNYVVFQILDFIKDKKIKEKVNITFSNDNRLLFSDITFVDHSITYTLKQDIDNLGFIIDVSMNNSLQSPNPCNGSYYYLVSSKYDETNAPSIDEKIKEKFNCYTDVILITQNNLLNKILHTMNISIYQSYNDKIIRNLFVSLALIFETDTKIYEHICPVCGSKKVQFYNSYYECCQCHSKYSLLTFKTKPVLWIKALRRD